MRRFMLPLAVVALLIIGMGTAGSEELSLQKGIMGNANVSGDVGADAVRLAQAAKSGAEAGFSDVAAIIEKYHCTVCHAGAESRDELRLDSYENVMKGGKGGPVVVAGSPAKSKLVQRVKGAKQPRMPMGGPPWLSDDEVKTLENWIAAGAKGPKS
jgi:uncharacterized membrane protein